MLHITSIVKLLNEFIQFSKNIFFVVNFCQVATKKRLANPTKGFLRIKKTIYHILRKKSWKLLDLDNVFHEVGNIRQDSKKDLLVHSDIHHLLLINSQDPCQYTYLRNLKKKTWFNGVNCLQILTRFLGGFINVIHVPQQWCGDKPRE